MEAWEISTNRMWASGRMKVDSVLSMKTGFFPPIVRKLLQIRATSDGLGSIRRSARIGCSLAMWTTTLRITGMSHSRSPERVSWTYRHRTRQP